MGQGKPFTIIKATSEREELSHPSCPACYRPLRDAGYCPLCIASGAAGRHQENRAAGW